MSRNPDFLLLGVLLTSAAISGWAIFIGPLLVM